jgi:hypothetical protein
MSLLKKLLFFRDDEAVKKAFAPIEKKGSVVVLMLRRQRGMSLEEFKRILLSTYANRLSARQKDIGYNKFKQRHTLPNSKSLLTVFAKTRSHKSVSFFCGLSGVEPPPYYEQASENCYDVFIELFFDGDINTEQAAGINTLIAELADITELVDSCECDKKYSVYDSGKEGDNPIQLVNILKNPWNKTVEEAQAYWRDIHAPLVAAHSKYINILSYDQFHATRNPDSPFGKKYNGIAWNRFNSEMTFHANSLRLSATRFNSTILVDEILVTVNSEFLMMKEYNFS